MLTTLLRTLLRGLRHVFTGILALLILFEEWGWEPLQRALARLARLPILRQIEAWIAGLSARPALVIFLLPTLLLLPVKLAALWLLSNGYKLLGAVLIITAKLIGTAIVARLFTLTRPALLTMPWFATLYARWTAWKEALLERVRESWAWRAGRVFKRGLKRQWARWRAQFTG